MVPVVHKARPRGFTLVEMLMVLGMVAVLCAITFPSYAGHLRKGRARAAVLDLAALALKMEAQAQQRSAYPVHPAGTLATPALFPGWAPVMGEHFRYTVQSDEAGYRLQAVGPSSLGDCTITLESNGSRSTSAGCGFSLS